MSNLLQTGAEFEKKLKERAESTEKMLNDEFRTVSYTHLDVYKRQTSTQREEVLPFISCVGESGRTIPAERTVEQVFGSKRLFRFRQVIRKGQRPAVLRGVGVMQTVMVIHQLSLIHI